MDNQRKNSGWQTFGVFSAAVAILGILIPILWDWYKTESAIELRRINTTSLVQVLEQPTKRLEIFYDGHPIKSLTKMTFQFTNTGRQPIRNTDISSLPTLNLKGSYEILEVNIEKKSPRNLQVKIGLSEVNHQSIVIDTPLINPAEYVTFSVLVTGDVQSFTGETRIAGLKNFLVLDSALQKISEKTLSLWGYVILVSTILGFILIIIGWREVKAIKQFKKKYIKGEIDLAGMSGGKYATLINQLKNIGYTDKELSYLKRLPIPNDELYQLNNADISMIITELNELTGRAPASFHGVIGMMFIVGFGIYYLYPYFCLWISY